MDVITTEKINMAKVEKYINRIELFYPYRLRHLSSKWKIVPLTPIIFLALLLLLLVVPSKYSPVGLTIISLWWLFVTAWILTYSIKLKKLLIKETNKQAYFGFYASVCSLLLAGMFGYMVIN
jgi:hypothetical protein